MTPDEKNRLHYVCALTEFLSRHTRTPHRVIAEHLTPEAFERLLRDAPVNHCLSFEEVAAPLIEALRLADSGYDVLAGLHEKAPAVEVMGWLYAQLISSIATHGCLWDAYRTVFTSFLPAAVSRFETSLHYASPSYLLACFKAGRVLAD